MVGCCWQEERERERRMQRERAAREQERRQLRELDRERREEADRVARERERLRCRTFRAKLTAYLIGSALLSLMWAQELCRIRPSRFLAECCMRRLN